MHESLRHIVQQSWKNFTKGSYAFQLTRKIDHLKKEIKTWKKFSESREFHVIDMIKRELAIKQYCIMNNSYDVSACQ